MQCFFCGGKDGKFVQSTRVESVISDSREREDGLLEKIEQGTMHITCHSNCISTYCSKHHIARLLAKRQQTESELSHSSKRLRSQHHFNFMEHCLFCGEVCIIIRPIK